MEKVSVIVPVYNNEKFVETCIWSLCRQTYQNLEILVINDGSSDNSGQILERMAEKDERIRLIHQKNAGVSAARNKGVELAEGEYLTFVDGDDYVSTDYIEKFYECAKKRKAELVICGVTYVEEDGRILKKIQPGEYRRFEKEEWAARISAVGSHFYKRSLWEKYRIRFQEGERGEDMPISLLFSALCDKICTLPQCGYYYVQHSSSAMHQFRGLKNYRLPYQALENAIVQVQKEGVVNSTEYYEWFVIRILCTCFFDLGRGASRKNMAELTHYIIRILETYFPGYNKNPKAGLFSKTEVPVVQKMATAVFRWLVHTKLIYAVAALLSH